MGIRDLAAVLTGAPSSQSRAITGVPWAGLGELLKFNGQAYLATNQTYGPNEPSVPHGERQAITSNGVVYGIVRARVDLFSQATFTWKRFGSSSRPMATDMFTSGDLRMLDNPASILEWCELDVAAAGNSYWVVDDGVLRRLPPQWCSIVLGSNRETDDPQLAWDARPVGLIYQPDGIPTDRAEVFTWDEIAHYAPEQDLDARWRGMSYLRPAMEDIGSDNGARRYLTKFFENNATSNLVFVFPPEVDSETVTEFADLYQEKHKGVGRAFRTGFIGGGADPKVIGSSLKDLDTENVRKQVHFDIAIAAGLNPMALGLMEVNYSNTKEGNRSISDRKLRYLWLKVVQAFRPILNTPPGAELWYDVSGVSALQSDALDDAEVQLKQFSMMETGVRTGYDPDAVTDAVVSGDNSKLRGKHTKLVSVQLQLPGATPAGAGVSDG